MVAGNIAVASIATVTAALAAFICCLPAARSRIHCWQRPPQNLHGFNSIDWIAHCYCSVQMVRVFPDVLVLIVVAITGGHS